VEREYDMADVAACFRCYGKLAGNDAGRVVDTGNQDSFSGSSTNRSACAG
jgi:betaine-aldehyde dehydrogenase